MSVDKTFILNLAPEFSSVSDPRIAFAITQASNFINSNVWPASQIDLAVGYMACHLLKIGSMAGSGAVASERVGDLSTSYFQPGGSGGLSMTGYGQQLLALMSTLVITPFFALQGLDVTPPAPCVLNWPD